MVGNPYVDLAIGDPKLAWAPVGAPGGPLGATDVDFLVLPAPPGTLRAPLRTPREPLRATHGGRPVPLAAALRTPRREKVTQHSHRCLPFANGTIDQSLTRHGKVEEKWDPIPLGRPPCPPRGPPHSSWGGRPREKKVPGTAEGNVHPDPSPLAAQGGRGGERNPVQSPQPPHATPRQDVQSTV